MAHTTTSRLAALVFCLAALGASAAENGDADRGKQLYGRNCAVCHGAADSGGLGPALKGVADRLTPDQALKQMMEPRGSMPRFYPHTLTDVDVRDVVTYVLTL